MSKNRKFGHFFEIFKIHFVPGRPGTEEFVPGHLLLPLSRDKGTAGQAKIFCPGTKGHRDREIFLSRDKGTTGRPVPVCPGMSRGTSRPVETLIDDVNYYFGNLLNFLVVSNESTHFLGM